MTSILVFFIPMILFGSALATVQTNKRGGHGIFQGLEDANNGKSSWMEESKVDNVKINQGNTNSLLSNTVSNTQKSSLYLQPEPRGLEYLLDVPDHNPFLFRKRDVSQEKILRKIRKGRQINLQSGYMIPGSRGQAVLYGVPNGNGYPTTFNGQQAVANSQQMGIPQNWYTSQWQIANSHVGGYKTRGY